MPVGTLIGIGSGLASALLLYSAARGGALLKFFLLVLIPLPLLIAGLGWGYRAAAAGGLAASVLIGIAASPTAGLAVLFALALPAALLAWFAELGQDGPEQVKWYPAGHILGMLALYGAAVSCAVGLMLNSFERLKPTLVPFVTSFAAQMQAQLKQPALTEAQIGALADRVIEAMPATFAAYWILLFVLNFYLAGRVTLRSGHLLRPWPDLHQIQPPVWLPLALAIGLGLSMLVGVPRMVGTALFGGTLIAFALFGLSVLHALAVGRVPWMLWLAYAALINPAAPYGVILLAMIGLLDPLFNWRQRFAKAPSPPGT
jgi:Predicted membrane protein (DUF2232)